MSNQNPLNLTENESKLYNTILVSGQLNFGEVRAVTRMTIEDLQIAITSLINKGLIREVPGLKGRYAALLPVGNLKSALDETATSIRNAQKDLENASESLVTKFQEDMHASSRALLAKIDETASSSQSNFESVIEDQNQRFTSLASEVITKTESVQTVNDTEKDRIIDDLKKREITVDVMPLEYTESRADDHRHHHNQGEPHHSRIVPRHPG
ncbi:MAG: hypothetical protein IH840_03670, partial [Candidatus Heimdallarchaeota archaeon]|nr:hypothetical protein [Candidatus Heimdallarchaeota archaeon]